MARLTSGVPRPHSAGHPVLRAPPRAALKSLHVRRLLPTESEESRPRPLTPADRPRTKPRRTARRRSATTWRAVLTGTLIRCGARGSRHRSPHDRTPVTAPSEDYPVYWDRMAHLCAYVSLRPSWARPSPRRRPAARSPGLGPSTEGPRPAPGPPVIDHCLSQRTAVFAIHARKKPGWDKVATGSTTLTTTRHEQQAQRRRPESSRQIT